MRGHLTGLRLRERAAGRLYLIALGSNRRHPRHGDPRRVLAAALPALHDAGIVPVATTAALPSAPLGPSRRRYANCAAIVEADASPPQLLAALKRIEQAFGRRPGQRWGARVLDLDIILWQGGRWNAGRRSEWLEIPHPHFHARDFVLGPAVRIAAGWRDPRSGLSIAQLRARLRRPVAACPAA